MKAIQILISLIILIGCQKKFDNKTDPSSIQYSLTQFVYINFEKLVGRGSAGVAELSALKYDPSEFGYTTTQNSIVGVEATVEFDRSLTSVSSTPLLPTGITFRQKDLCCQITSFLLTPDSNTKISQPLTKYTITGCRNGNNCITTEIFIQIANDIGSTVWGQNGSFFTESASVTATGLNNPRGMALDSTGGLYVADFANNRVLFYPNNSQTATRVYGQAGSFTTNTSNNGGLSANSLKNPSAVAVDSTNGLYITDTFNNRILYFTSGSTTASRVYGQAGAFNTDTNVFTPSATNLNFVTMSGGGSLALDSSDNLYVTDPARARVLFFPNGSTTATRVYGQGGSFTTGIANTNANTLDNLNSPTSVFVSGNIVYILDVRSGSSSDPSRILSYISSSTTANESLTLSSSLSFTFSTPAIGMYVDTSGGIYLPSGSSSTAVVEYYRSMKAKKSLYRFGTFSSPLSRSSTFGAHSVILDSANNVYMSQLSSNRIVKYNK